jgi:hypothetical protein
MFWKKKKLKVIITEQSFAEAGGRDLFGRLKMLGPVYTTLHSEEIIPANLCNDFEKINLALSNKALEIKSKYVFDIKYERGTNNRICGARGTAYRKTPWYPFKNFR